MTRPAMPLEDRRQAYEKAEAAMGAVAVRWLDARVVGPVPAALGRELEEARRVVRRTLDALHHAEQRLAKRKEAA